MKSAAADIRGARAAARAIAALLVAAGALLAMAPERRSASVRVVGGPPPHSASLDPGAAILDAHATAAPVFSAARPSGAGPRSSVAPAPGMDGPRHR